MSETHPHRNFLKGYSEKILEDWESDQQKGLSPPPVQEKIPDDAQLIDLTPPSEISVGDVSLAKLINQRKSHRLFSPESLTLEELSFLLWSTQGVHRVVETREKEVYCTLRTVPSAGARHPFETYLLINRVESLEPGLYRYLALEHKLTLIRTGDHLPGELVDGCHGQKFAGVAAVTFVWSVIPYRSEWRYMRHAAKYSALDAGHVCQDLYLASEAIGAGTCGIAAYLQEKMDAFIGVDGTDEFTIYIAPVGKLKKQE